MSETCNRRKKCTNLKHDGYDKCILHCDKTGFNETERRLFWQEIRETYVKYDVHDISEEIVIEGVIFPFMDAYNYHNNPLMFRHPSHLRFLHNVKFIKCTFTNDFNLNNVSSNKKMIFDNCLFYGDIQLASANEIDICNSEFKHNLSLGRASWLNLHICSTKFVNDASFTIRNNLNIDESSIFRGDLKIFGNTTLNLNLQNIKCSKQLHIQQVHETNIDNIDLNSHLFFNIENKSININNMIFSKDVIFDEFSDLLIYGSEFNRKTNFNATSYETSRITIENTKMNDLEFPSISILNIIDESEIRGCLKVNGSCQNLSIDNSNISKKFDIQNATTVVMNKCNVNEDSVFHGDYNDVSISECSFISLMIKSTNRLEITTNTKIVNNLDLSGEQYENILIDSSKIANRLLVGKVTQLTLNNVKSKPYVKLSHDEYETVTIQDSNLFDLEISSMKVLEISKSTIKGTLSFSEETSGNIILETVTLKNKCDFPNLNTLVINNNSTFDKEINLNKISSVNCNDTRFKGEMTFLSEYLNVQFEACVFYQKMKLSKVSNTLEIKSCTFKDEVDFCNGDFSNINILSSSFNGNFLLSSSYIEKINFDSATEEVSNNSFSLLVDFTDSQINDIKLHYCDFQGALHFENMKQIINLSDMVWTIIQDLKISNSLVFDLFKDTHQLEINNFNLVNSKLDTTSMGKEIDISKVTIAEFKCNKVILLKVINFSEMAINKFRIGNSNIEHRFRIKESTIGEFSLISSTFEDLQIIDNQSDKVKTKRELILKNTTIKNAVLDKLKYTKFTMSDAHVSEAKIGNVQFTHGSRETYRFFKNYYDSISDYIKANEYYQNEMIEHYKNTKDKGEKIVLWFGKKISSFGQSWIYPLLWMLLFTLIFYRIANFDLLSMDGFRENHIGWMINDVFKFVNPFSKSSTTNYGNLYWAWIVHKVFMTIFTYHFIVAIKRKTRR